MRKVIISFLFIVLFLKYPLIAFSNNCTLNFYSCSDEELCKHATYVENGLIVWNSKNNRKNHVEHAQEKGLVCEVGNPIKVSEETLLTPDFLSKIKTGRKTKVDWKGLICKNTNKKKYNIWFDNGEYLLFKNLYLLSKSKISFLIESNSESEISEIFSSKYFLL